MPHMLDAVVLGLLYFVCNIRLWKKYSNRLMCVPDLINALLCVKALCQKIFCVGHRCANGKDHLLTI